MVAARQSGGSGWSSIFLGFVLPAALIPRRVALLVIFTMGGQKAEAPELRAAIVDQLGLNQSNPDFVQTARSTLKDQAGYTVDYYPAEQVTVDSIVASKAELPSHRLSRSHRAVRRGESDVDDPQRRQALIDAFGNSAFLFTSEQYDSSKYPDDRQNSETVPGAESGGLRRYAILRDHAGLHRVRCRATSTRRVILLMGCDGLLFDGTAKAFVDKGAEAVVGWDALVSPQHTDETTQTLLQKLVPQKLPLGEAVQRTMSEIAPEPAYNNKLKIYPEKAGNLVLPRG